MTVLTSPPVVGASRFGGSSGARLADHCADVLALGWRRRQRALVNPTLDFADLHALDDRMQAALDALAFLGPEAAAHMRGLMSEPIRQAEMFALACHALAAGDQALCDACAAVASTLADLRPAWAAALEWAPACGLLEATLESLPAALRMPLTAVRQRDFPRLLARTLAWLPTIAMGPEDTAAAFEMIRRLGRCDLAPAALRHLVLQPAPVRLAAARCLLVLTPREHGPTALATLLELTALETGPLRAAALQSVALHAPAAAASALAGWDGGVETRRLRLQALAWVGEVAAVPELAEALDDPQLCRVAGAALALITGSDPARDGWLGTRPEPQGNDELDHIPQATDDDELPWPDPAAYAAWWRRHAHRFSGSQRYFAGRPITLDWLTTVLTTGPLPWRQLAAEHRQRLTLGPLFPTHLPAAAQHARFDELI